MGFRTPSLCVVALLLAQTTLAGPFAFLCVPGCTAGFVACMGGATATGPAAAVIITACYAQVTACNLACIGGTCLDGNNFAETLDGPKKISELQAGDKVATLNENRKSFTTVIKNTNVRGIVKFSEIRLDNGRAFNATHTHIVAVRRESGLEMETAKNVRVGDVMVTSESDAKVLATRSFERSSRWTLGTDTGSVLVNGVLVSSICDSNFEVLPTKNFSEGLRVWREDHSHLTEGDSNTGLLGR